MKSEIISIAIALSLSASDSECKIRVCGLPATDGVNSFSRVAVSFQEASLGSWCGHVTGVGWTLTGVGQI